MLTNRQEDRFESVLSNYRNGNLSDAAKAVRGLSKLELIKLVNNIYALPSGFIGDNAGRVNFFEFIEKALDGYYK